MYAEHTRNRFHCTLSIPGTKLRACSASGKMWTGFTCTIHAERMRNKFYCTLSIHGNDFIACRANTESISSHAEHARKCLKVEYLVLQALGTIWFRFLQKSQNKNFMLVYLLSRWGRRAARSPATASAAMPTSPRCPAGRRASHRCALSAPSGRSCSRPSGLLLFCLSDWLELT